MELPLLDVDGTVTAEVFVIGLREDGIVLSGPCGPAPWLIETGGAENPMAAVERLARGNLGELVLLHSTSWRYDRGSVVLSFVALVPPECIPPDAVPVVQVELTRGSALSAPELIGWPAVLEHGLRHLAWLAQDDPSVRAALDAGWLELLQRYTPAPFQHIGESP